MKNTIRTLTLGVAALAIGGVASSAMAQQYHRGAYDYYNGRYDYNWNATRLPYAPGYSAIPPSGEYNPYSSGGSYGSPSYWQPDRTYPGQVTGYPPFGTPFYPGPRPTGSMGGGTGGGG